MALVYSGCPGQGTWKTGWTQGRKCPCTLLLYLRLHVLPVTLEREGLASGNREGWSARMTRMGGPGPWSSPSRILEPGEETPCDHYASGLVGSR